MENRKVCKEFEPSLIHQVCKKKKVNITFMEPGL